MSSDEDIAGIFLHFSVHFCFSQASMRLGNILSLSKAKGGSLIDIPVFLFSDQKSIRMQRSWVGGWIVSSWNGAQQNQYFAFLQIVDILNLDLPICQITWYNIMPFYTIHCHLKSNLAICKVNFVLFLLSAVLTVLW